MRTLLRSLVASATALLVVALTVPMSAAGQIDSAAPAATPSVQASPAPMPSGRLALACPEIDDSEVPAIETITAGDGAITGTSTADLAAFAGHFNEIRVENCLDPVPFSNFRHDACMETRLIWMAEDPSTDPSSAWGHEGSERSDGVPSVGCDGNLAGGDGDTAITVAEKWWASAAHRAILYRPDLETEVEDVCIAFAMTHGGVPNEPDSFTRAAARWTTC